MKNLQLNVEQYVDIVNKVALISKTDSKGTIIYANDIFCQVAGYTKEELIGKPHNLLRHPDMSKQVFTNLWDDIKRGKNWNGKIKNKAKDGNSYHVNAHIFPIYDDINNITEFMAVRFLITEDMEKQRQIKSQIRDKLSIEKLKQQELKKEIQSLHITVKSYKDKLTLYSLMKDKLEHERKNKSQLIQQINSYEEELENMSKIAEVTIDNAKQTKQSTSIQLKVTKDKVKSLEENNAKLSSMIRAQKHQIVRYEDSLKSQAILIKNLKDVIASLENDKEKLLNEKATHTK